MKEEISNRDLIGKFEGKRPLGRYRRRWEANIKIDLKDIGWGVWTRFVWFVTETSGGICEHGKETSGFI